MHACMYVCMHACDNKFPPHEHDAHSQALQFGAALVEHSVAVKLQVSVLHTAIQAHGATQLRMVVVGVLRMSAKMKCTCWGM